LFYPKIKVGDHVKEGQIIGEIKDLKGDVLETLAAPNNGLVNLIMCNPVKLPGDLLFKTLAK
jgi:biotin carboxyl carrier protein